ncbi:MAG: hypothetical protein EA383_09615 [Spirochaetaceae bacterium]|nr:MAG: hypothetical protein EA383_09615 [Spirochaetaceae bacterium]
MKLYTTRHLVITGAVAFILGTLITLIVWSCDRHSEVPAPPVSFVSYEDVLLSVYDVASPAVVRVFTEAHNEVPENSSGQTRQTVAPGASGILLDREGHVVTGLHVVDGSRGIRVSDTAGRTFDAEIVAVRESSDLAILRVSLPADHALRPVQLADSQTLRIGQLAFVIGNPFALGRSLTSGVVSALNRTIHIDEQVVFRNMIQTDAAVNPGASGGGLFDSSGRLIGIVSVLYSTQGGSMGIAFAVPSNDVRDLLDTVPGDGNRR